jgi:apolipoprotein N-acyltransferase
MSRRPATHAAWAVTGAAFTALAVGTSPIAAAAWLAPLFVLRFVREVPARVGVPAAATLTAIAYAAAWRGTYGIPLAGFAAVGLLFFLPVVVDRLLAQRIGGVAGTLVFPSATVALEYLLAFVPLAGDQPLGAWASVAHSQAGNLPLLQLASVTGAWGITFVVSWFGSLLAWAWAQGAGSTAATRAVTGFAVLVAVLLVGGGWRLAATPSVESYVRVAAIAVDNPAHTVGVWNPVARGRGLGEDDVAGMRARLATLHDSLWEATAREARAGARIVVWAEDNAIVFADDEAELIERAQEVAGAHDIHLFMGMVTLVPGQKAENKVVAVTPDGAVAFSYLKSYPTPWEASQRGDGTMRFVETPYGTVGVAICYDADHPGLMRQAGVRGADILLVPADDGMQVAALHAHMAAIRAIENGAALVRPVIGGHALAVDAYGRVLGQAEYGVGAYFAGGTHTLVVHVPTRGVRTLYAVLGDWLAYLCIAAIAAAVALASIRWLRRAPAHPGQSSVSGVSSRFAHSDIEPSYTSTRG